MATKIKLGNGNWGVKENGLLAYNDEDGIFKAIEMEFSRSSTATRESSAGLIDENAIGVPRIDFSDSSDGALLLEPESSNYVTQSEDFSTWATNESSVASSSELNPFSGQSYELIASTNNVNGHRIQNNFSTYLPISNRYTCSLYVKSKGYESVTINVAASRVGATFGLTSKSVLNTFSNGTDANNEEAGIEELSNGWFRVYVSFDVITTTMDYARIIVNETEGVWGSNGETYVGDGTSGIYIYQSQVENLSYPSSIIKTSGATATRVAETLSKSGLENYINSIEGVLYLEVLPTQASTIQLYGGLSNRIWVQLNEVDTKSFINNGSGTTSLNTNSESVNFNSYRKVALSYRENEFKLCVNGVLNTITPTQATFSANSLTYLRFDYGSLPFYGKLKDLKVYDTVLSDSELQTLTTL